MRPRGRQQAVARERGRWPTPAPFPAGTARSRRQLHARPKAAAGAPCSRSKVRVLPGLRQQTRPQSHQGAARRHRRPTYRRTSPGWLTMTPLVRRGGTAFLDDPTCRRNVVARLTDVHVTDSVRRNAFLARRTSPGWLNAEDAATGSKGRNAFLDDPRCRGPLPFFSALAPLSRPRARGSPVSYVALHARERRKIRVRHCAPTPASRVRVRTKQIRERAER